jgi:hypothetical protein
MNKKRFSIIVLISSIVLILVVLSTIFGSTLWFYAMGKLYGDKEIQQISSEIVANETDVIGKLHKLADWVKENIHYDANLTYYYPTEPFMMFRLQDPSYIMVTRRGACEETASLFQAMANSIGIKTRTVHNPGEDHTWCEVFVNGSWLHFDPGLSKNYRFNDPHFYERSENGWGKPLSYVYFLDSHGIEIDVTNKYTDTGKLAVLVQYDDVPIENAKITIKSHSLMDNNFVGYSAPLRSIEKYTNSSGICEFNLGGNNYTIIAESGILFKSKAQTIHQIIETSSTTITLTPEEFMLFPSMVNVMILAITILFSCLFMIISAQLLIKRADVH